MVRINWSWFPTKMATGDAVINVEGGSDVKSGLTFHEFHSVDPSLPSGAIEGYSDPVKEDLDAGDQDQLLESGKSTTRTYSWVSFLTLEYYQSLFDVTTAQVAHRMLAGTVPLKLSLVEAVRPNPDLYGPFWLCMTLVFSTALSGNITRVFQEREGWEFHFHEVTVLGSVVYAYTWGLPAVLWGLLWWRGNRNRYTLLELLAIYGYCIAIFIPISVLWVIHSEILRWTLLVVGTLLSGSSLVLAVWQPLKTESRNLAIAVVAVLFLMHAGLALGFKFYYFSSALAPPTDYSSATPAHTVSTNSTA